MRIRRFFEHLENTYYRSASWKPVNQQVQQIDQKLRDKLLEMFPVFRKPIETEKAFTSKSKLIYGKSLDRVDVDILQSNDEWFYVRIIDKIGKSTTWRGTRYFTCDQFEGSVDCIQNEIIEKSKQE